MNLKLVLDAPKFSANTSQHKGVELSMIVGKLLLSSRSYQPSSDMNVKPVSFSSSCSSSRTIKSSDKQTNFISEKISK